VVDGLYALALVLEPELLVATLLARLLVLRCARGRRRSWSLDLVGPYVHGAPHDPREAFSALVAGQSGECVVAAIDGGAARLQGVGLGGTAVVGKVAEEGVRVAAGISPLS
jgi:hypothetical protein